MTLRFSCKDPVLARHYDFMFRELFESQWSRFKEASEGEQQGIKAAWRQTMYAEALRQQHYDYIVNDEGMREVIHQGDRNTPKLLIPQIEIT